MPRARQKQVTKRAKTNHRRTREFHLPTEGLSQLPDPSSNPFSISFHSFTQNIRQRSRKGPVRVSTCQTVLDTNHIWENMEWRLPTSSVFRFAGFRSYSRRNSRGIELPQLLFTLREETHSSVKSEFARTTSSDQTLASGYWKSSYWPQRWKSGRRLNIYRSVYIKTRKDHVSELDQRFDQVLERTWRQVYGKFDFAYLATLTMRWLVKNHFRDARAAATSSEILHIRVERRI